MSRSDQDNGQSVPTEPAPKPSLWRLALAFAKVGTVGFGGGVGMLGVLRGMHFCRLVAGDFPAVRKMVKVE